MFQLLATKIIKLIVLSISSILIFVTFLVAYTSLREISQFLGLKQVTVPVIGTGSMYPSLFWAKSEQGPDDIDQSVIEEYRTTPRMYRRFPGFTLFGHTYLSHSIEFGDMVAFKNETTRAILVEDGKDPKSGFIKRVIGLPRDTIEFRDGYVLRNGKRIEEPYLYRPRSSYGQENIQDCQSVVIPPGHYLVLGDNRKISADSRGELGLIADVDIKYLLPYSQQNLYHSLWRDTSQDDLLLGTPTLDNQEFYRLLSLARAAAGVSPLSVQSSLVRSATLRGSQVLAGQPSSLASSLKEVGYSNIATGEFITRGHFTAEELLQNLLYFPNTSSQVLDSQYQNIGLVAVNQEVNGCPTQIIVGQMGGYIPANYPSEVVASWQALVSNLVEIIPSWEQARKSQQLDQVKLSELLTILHARLDFARAIVGSMQDNKWLTDDQKQNINNDTTAAARATELIKELNGE